jgi:hypothetical protein
MASVLSAYALGYTMLPPNDPELLQ